MWVSPPFLCNDYMETLMNFTHFDLREALGLLLVPSPPPVLYVFVCHFVCFFLLPFCMDRERIILSLLHLPITIQGKFTNTDRFNFTQRVESQWDATNNSFPLLEPCCTVTSSSRIQLSVLCLSFLLGPYKPYALDCSPRLGANMVINGLAHMTDS